jgi:inhibitor of cysteine peptidase
MLREGPASRVTATGDTAEVQLPESPSTGYRWHLDDPGNDVTVVDTSYHDSSSSPLAGGTGVRVFRLRLDRPAQAETEVPFLLRRPWERPEQAIERRIVTVA